MRCVKRRGEIGHKYRKGPCQRVLPRHKNIVIAREREKGKHRVRGRTQAPFCPISFDGTTDLATGGHAKAHLFAREACLRRPRDFERK